MPIPNTMKLVEKDGAFALTIDIQQFEHEILSVIDIKGLRKLWVPWQTQLERLRNDPDNIEALKRRQEEQAEMLSRLQAKMGERIENSDHYNIMMEAYENAGERGLIDEELSDACVEIQHKRSPKTPLETLKKGWSNRHRSIRGQFHLAGIIIMRDEKRPTASSRARHLAEGKESTGVAAVWRKRNLPIGEHS
jgi:hypothetical protein